MLKIKKLVKKIGHKTILNNLNLQVDYGKIGVLLGSSGVGKSTLFRILNNLESINQGEIELDGKLLDLTKVNQEHTVGLVFQHFNLFEHLTVMQNITLALEQVLNQTAQQAQVVARALLKRYDLLDQAEL